jgi:hypothetical protein
VKNELRQQTVVAGANPDQTEAAVRLHALANRSAMALIRQTNLESRQIALTRQIEHATGAQQAQLAKQLADVQTDLAAAKEDLADSRQKIQELQGTLAPLPPLLLAPPAPVAIVGVPSTIFGRTPLEAGAFGAFLLLLPIALAAARGIWRRGSGKVLADAAYESSDRFTRLEQAVESVAIEVERIGESQRYSARLLAEQQGAPAVPAAKEGAYVERR